MTHLLHPLINDSYVHTKSWLDSRPDLTYRNLSYEQIKTLLRKNEYSLQNAAAQFHTYFPGHHFKVIEVLQNALSKDTVLNWLKYNPHICILDIGCGAGAASSGFIELLLTLQEQRAITQDVSLFCLGVDPNRYAAVLYSQFLSNLKEKVQSSKAYKLHITHKIILEGFPAATSQIITALQQQREVWRQPQFAHCIIMQVNVVSPLQDSFNKRQDDRLVLMEMGLDDSILAQDDTEFGIQECLAYRSIFESVLIDNLHVFTVSTDNHMLDQRVVEMGQALNRTFIDRRHRINLLAEGQYSVNYFNPADSFWGNNNRPYPTTFHANITSILNEELRTDSDWQEVISEDNLQLAWVRARQSLLGESFIDEIGIRIFEINRDDNLKRMQLQLMAYANDLAKNDDYIAYKVPKSLESVRPRGLSHFEEELLSIAIIQKLGKKESQLRGSSYAYRISSRTYQRNTEYLYEPWFDAYKHFIRDARTEATKYANGAVIRVDIRSFFTNILQNQLIEMTQNTLTQSQRVHWLIKLLLSRNLDDHDVGRGIVQGSPGSGFYANIYLTPVDVRFGVDNEWKAKIFRFVDDIILVVPEQDDKNLETAVDEILKAVKEELSNLQLELNVDKTAVYYNVTDFIHITEQDTLLEEMSERYLALINSLWLLNQDELTRFREFSQNNEQWWFQIELYSKLLQSVGVFVAPTFVSRQIAKYLYNTRRRNKDIKQSLELTIPAFTHNGQEMDAKLWQQLFTQSNSRWVQRIVQLRNDLVSLFCESWEFLQITKDIEASHAKQIQTRMKFAINRLSVLGFGASLESIIQVLTNSPWIIREVLHPIESLARQGFISEVTIVDPNVKTRKS